VALFHQLKGVAGAGRLQEFLDALDGKQPEDWSPATVRELIKTYIDVIGEASWKASTIRSARSRLRSRLLRRLRDVRIRHVGQIHVLRWLADMRKARYAESTRASTFRLVRGAFTFGVGQGWLKRNPTDGVERPRYDPDPDEMENYWTLDEAVEFLTAVREHDPRYLCAFLLVMTTGLRIGEVRALRWADVDLRKAVLHVRTRLIGSERDTPKNRRKRKHSLGPAAVEAPKAQRRWVALRSEAVFPGGRADRDECRGLVTENKLREVLYRLSREKGLPRVTFHGLRHTVGTALADLGVMEKGIQARLGHRTPGMVARYIHIRERADQQAATLLEEALAGVMGITFGDHIREGGTRNTP